MNELMELYLRDTKKYNTDKEHPNHGYISKCYSVYFQQYKKRKINLLEIGLGGGGSLLLWSDYFSDIDAKIYGIDNGNDYRFGDCLEKTKSIKKIKIIVDDAYKKEIVDNLPNFDIIIDDGPHNKDSQIKFLELYLPKLKAGGTLIIEDIEDINYIEDFKNKLDGQYRYSIIDTATEKEYNSLLFVVRKL